MRGAKTSPGESKLPLLVMERILVVINAEVSAFQNDSTGTKKKKKNHCSGKAPERAGCRETASALPAALWAEAPQQWPGARPLWLCVSKQVAPRDSLLCSWIIWLNNLSFVEKQRRASLVAQEQRIHLLMQETWGLIPGPGRSHIPRSKQFCAP